MADLICYRGERKASWGAPELRLNDGLTVRKPWTGGALPAVDAARVWAALVADIQTLNAGNISAYAQTLRSEGKTYAMATARTNEGSFTSDFDYTTALPNARTFRWAGDGRNPAAEVPWVEHLGAIDDDYIVLNAATVAQSTVVGFGHKTGTHEVTFFTDIQASWVTHVNGKPSSAWATRPKKDFTMDERILMRDLVRPPARFA